MLLAFLVLLIPFLAFWFFWIASVVLDRQMDSIEEKFQSVRTDLGGDQKPSEQSAEAKLAESRAELVKLEAEFSRLKSSALPIILASRIVGGLFLGGFCIGFSFWFPFVVMRRRFAHELDRFTLRIQGLASKPELAELALTESRVTDEQTLRSFVEAARRVAMRHEVPQLVTTFDLWRDAQSNP